MSSRLPAIAYHEAGHVVMALIEREPYGQVTIIPAAQAAGSMSIPPEVRIFLGSLDWTSEPENKLTARAKRWVRICYAGTIAQKRFAPRSHVTGSQQDWQVAYQILSKVFPSEEAEEESYEGLIKLLTKQTEQSIASNWEAIERIAEALLEKRVIRADDIPKIAGIYSLRRS